jgi:cytochrome c biogenesis protein CcdA
MMILGINNIGLLDKFKSLQTFSGVITDSSNKIRSSLMSKMGGKSDYFSAFIFGIVISIALGPCSLALVLPAVMMTLFNAPSAIHGGLQLLAFGIGHSLPVLFLSVVISETRYLISKRLVKVGGALNYIIGAGLVLLGLWLIIEAF